MGVIDMVRKFSEKKSVDKKRFKEVETERKIERILNDREKSANERELLKIMKQKREDNIKNELDKIHKQQNSDMWKSKHGVLDKGISITRNDRPILKEKNIFLDKKNNIPFVKGEQMFFKR
jgi:hypothetical protein